MPFELQAVLGTVFILFVLLMIQGGLVPATQGLIWGLGNRDEAKSASVLQERTTRTVANHIEGMLLFVPLALVIQAMGMSGPLTVLGSGLYLAGRIVFAPLYLFGVPYLRSAAWGIALLGIIIVAIPVISALI